MLHLSIYLVGTESTRTLFFRISCFVCPRQTHQHTLKRRTSHLSSGSLFRCHCDNLINVGQREEAETLHFWSFCKVALLFQQCGFHWFCCLCIVDYLFDLKYSGGDIRRRNVSQLANQWQVRDKAMKCEYTEALTLQQQPKITSSGSTTRLPDLAAAQQQPVSTSLLDNTWHQSMKIPLLGSGVIRGFWKYTDISRNPAHFTARSCPDGVPAGFLSGIRKRGCPKRKRHAFLRLRGGTCVRADRDRACRPLRWWAESWTFRHEKPSRLQHGWCDGPQCWCWQHLLAADNCWQFHVEREECVCTRLQVCKHCILCRRRDRRAVWLCWRVCISGCREQALYSAGAVAAKSKSHLEVAEGDPQLLHSWDYCKKKIQL